MLQEKLVERLLCPRVRTARQKVKSWISGGRMGGKEVIESGIVWKKEKVKEGLVYVFMSRKLSYLSTRSQHLWCFAFSPL